jgi:hypothetical protein
MARRSHDWEWESEGSSCNTTIKRANRAVEAQKNVIGRSSQGKRENLGSNQTQFLGQMIYGKSEPRRLAANGSLILSIHQWLRLLVVLSMISGSAKESIVSQY